ncbi:MAG: hypothetical protein ACTJHW_03295 [Paenalcaligenes sp.]
MAKPPLTYEHQIKIYNPTSRSADAIDTADTVVQNLKINHHIHLIHP